MTVTLADKIALFRSIFGLNRSDDVRHEAIHAMTGLGISAPDEMRAIVLQNALETGKNYAQIDSSTPAEASRGFYFGVVNHFAIAVRNPEGHSALYTAQSCALEMRRVRALDPDEISAMRSLSKHMQDKIIKLMGDTFNTVKQWEILNIPFKEVDFVARAQAIKARYDRPENNWLERKVTELFRAEAARKKMDVQKIPAAGTPWIGSAP